MDILHQQATSGFLKIPVELRTMIYKGLLPHNYLITFRPYTHAKDTGSDRAVYRGFIIEFGSRNMGEDVLEERSTAIMRVNKQIYAEIVDCLYRQNDYVFIQARDKRVIFVESSIDDQLVERHRLFINPMLFLSHNVLRLMRQCRIEISEEVFRKDDYNSVWESLEETVAAFGNNHCLEHLEIKLDTRRFVFTTRPNRKFALVKGKSDLSDLSDAEEDQDMEEVEVLKVMEHLDHIKAVKLLKGVGYAGHVEKGGVVHVVHDPLVEEDDDDGEFDDDEFEEVQEDGEYAEYWTPVGPHDDPRRYSKYKHCLEPLADLQGIKEVLMDGPCDDHFSRHLAEVMMGKRPKPPPKEYPSKVVKRRRPGHIRIHRQETVTTRKFYEPTLQWDKSASEASKTDGGPNV